MVWFGGRGEGLRGKVGGKRVLGGEWKGGRRGVREWKGGRRGVVGAGGGGRCRVWIGFWVLGFDFWFFLFGSVREREGGKRGR